MTLAGLHRLRKHASAVALGALALHGPLVGEVRANIAGFAVSGISTSRVVSPAVVASWVSHQDDLRSSTTTLLVLWRGTPGWFLNRSSDGKPSTSTSLGSSFETGRSGAHAYEYMSAGGLTLAMEFDYDAATVKILNRRISLRDTNIVLVDFVDNPSGPQIVGYRWVAPQSIEPAPSGDPIAAIVKRTPVLFDYLRCDLSLPDPLAQAMMPIICSEMRPKE